MQRVSRVTGGIIKHPVFDEARDLFIPLCCGAGDGLVIALLGPTQSGKSLIFNEVVSELSRSFEDQRPGAIPIINLQIETVNDGRAKPKWLGIELLKVLRHPIYQHIGCLDERDHYIPSRGLDEGRIRTSLKEAFGARFARRVCLEEAHLLTRTKDPELRASILESVKSSCAIDRTLIVCGGYELAYKGLFDSSHFCGRVITVDMGNYEAKSKEDVEAWTRILKTYSGYLDLKPKSLLVDEFPHLLEVTNGVIGLLDKMLWVASIKARAKESSIDKRILYACTPPVKEQRAIALDIAKGCESLANDESVIRRSKSTVPKSLDPCLKGEPFVRKPTRNAAMSIEVHDDG
jgi:hypothetical protein